MVDQSLGAWAPRFLSGALSQWGPRARGVSELHQQHDPQGRRARCKQGSRGRPRVSALLFTCHSARSRKRQPGRCRETSPGRPRSFSLLQWQLGFYTLPMGRCLPFELVKRFIPIAESPAALDFAGYALHGGGWGVRRHNKNSFKTFQRLIEKIRSSFMYLYKF